MTDRLKAIEAKCKEREWLWGNFHQGLFDIALAIGPPRFDKYGEGESKKFRDFFYKLADNIFALYGGGPVVEIVTDRHGNCFGCDLWEPDYHNGCVLDAEDKQKAGHLPGPNCPGPGKYKLVKVVDECDKPTVDAATVTLYEKDVQPSPLHPTGRHLFIDFENSTLTEAPGPGKYKLVKVADE